jgi:hypothetical protein
VEEVRGGLEVAEKMLEEAIVLVCPTLAKIAGP